MKEYQEIPFPKREWTDVAKLLKETGSCSTIRCCEQLGKYKIGDIYKTPWGDIIEITQVNGYTKVEDIPTWHLMNKNMKISVQKGRQLGNSHWDYIIFKLIK